jgi:Concanavalin A-like lectin/glucanases superfamily
MTKKILGKRNQNTNLTSRSGVYSLQDQYSDKVDAKFYDDASKVDYTNDWKNRTEFDPFYDSVIVHTFYEPTAEDHILKDKSDNHWDEFYSYKTGRAQVNGADHGPRYLHSTHFWSDYYTIADCPELNFGNGDFTIEFWIKLTRNDATEHFVMSKTGVASKTTGSGWAIYLTSKYQLSWFDAGTGMYVSTAQTLERDKWYYVAFTRSTVADIKMIKIYVDGVLSGSGVSDSFLTNTNNLNIGRDGAATSTNWFGGLIFDIRVTKRDLYTNTYPLNYTVPTTVPGTVLELGRGATITDTSGNNQVVTVVGDTKVSAESPFTRTLYSYEFDGSDSVTITPSYNSSSFADNIFTLEMFVYPRTMTTSQYSLFYLSGINDTARGLHVSLISSGQVQLDNRYDGSTIRKSVTTNLFNVNAWNHIAIVMDAKAASISIYLNGKMSGVASAYTWYDVPSMRLTLGGSINGYISNLRYTLGERLYYSDFDVPAFPLTDETNTVLLTAKGTTFSDSSSTNKQLIVYGDTSIVNFSPEDRVNNSVYFDGSGDYLYVAPTNALGFGVSDFTIECWVYAMSLVTNGPGTIFDLRTGATSTALNFRFNATLKPVVFDGVNNVDKTLTGNLRLKEWTHVALTRENGLVRCFLNGIFAGSTTVTSDLGNIQPIRIGSNQTASYDFHGYISNFRVSKGIALYTGDFTPPSNTLIPNNYTTLLTCQAPVIRDNSINNLYVAQVGNAAPALLSPFATVSEPSNDLATKNSVYFDGQRDYITLSASPLLSTGQFTFEAWIQCFSSAFNKMVIYSNYDSTQENRFYISRGITGCLTVSHGSGEVVSTTRLSEFRWYHIAVTRDSSNTLRIFINGQLDKTELNWNKTIYTSNPRISGYSGKPTSLFYGYISNLAISNTAKYTTSFNEPTLPVTVDSTVKLLTLRGNTVTDESSSPLTLTKYGNLSTTSTGPYSVYAKTDSFGYSMYFDGTGDYLSFTGTHFLTPSTNDFTVEFWFYNTHTTWSRAMDFIDAASTGLAIYMNSTGQLCVTKQSIAGVSKILGSVTTTNASLNQWNHFAIVRNSGYSSAYINGVRLAQPVADTNSYGSFSKVGGTGDGYIMGYLSGLKYVDSVALYTSNFTPSTRPIADTIGTNFYVCNKMDVVDSSVIKNALTVNGNVVPTSFSPFSPQVHPLEKYQSVYFDGTGDYLSIPTNAAFNFGTGDFTVECWINPNALTTNMDILGNFQSASVTNWGFMIGASYNLRFTSYNQNFLTGTPVSTGQWVHIAVSRSGSTLSMWQNGVRTATATNTTDFTSGNALQIGFNGDAAFNGYISNVRVVKGTALYTANFTPSTTPLTAVSGTSLLACAASTFIDTSYKSGIVPNGNVSVSDFSPFVKPSINETLPTQFKYSYYFNGTGDYLTLLSNSTLAPENQDFTIEAWVYPTVALSSYNSIFETSVTNGLYFGKIANGYGVRSSGSADLISAPAPAINQWVHIAVTRSGTSLRIFLNGVLKSTVTNSTNFPAGVCAIGASSTGSNPFTGYISNLRFVKGSALYVADFTPSTTPLVVTNNTMLLTCQSDTIVDMSRARLALTRVGSVVPIPNSPFGNSSIIYHSAYFDGNGDNISGTAVAAQTLGTSDFTIEAWVNLTNIPASDGAVLDWRSSSSSVTGFSFIVRNSTRKLRFYFGTTGIDSTSVVPGNTWAHIAVVRAGTTIKLYINGVLDATTGTCSNTFSDTGFQIGGTTTFSNSYLTGYISNLRVVKGAALYSTSFTPSTSRLTTSTTGVTVLLTCNKLSLVDDGAYNTTLTANGNTVMVSDTTPVQTVYNTTGKFGLYMPGGSGLRLYDRTALDFGTTNFTIEAWINLNAMPTVDTWPANYSSTMVIVGVGTPSLGDGFCFLIGATKLLFHVSDVGYVSTVNHDIVVGKWYHVAMVRNSGTITFYVNGVAKGTISLATAIGSTGTNTYIGCETEQGAYFNGTMSNLRVVKGTAVYTSSFTPVTALTAITNTSLLACSTDKFIDRAEGKFLQPLGSAVITTRSPFVSNTTPTADILLDGSWYFDGNGDYLSLPASTNYDIMNGNFTIEMFVNFSSLSTTGQQHHLVQIGTSSTNRNTLYLRRTDSKICFYTQTSAGSGDLIAATTVCQYNTWYHVALVKNSSTFTLYVDGVSQGTSTSTRYATGAAQNIHIGFNNFGGAATDYLQGYMSNLRIVSNSALYTANFTKPSAKLTAVANTQLLTVQNSEVVDNSTNKATITKNGETRFVQATPFDAGYGLGSPFFDGTGDYLSFAANAAFAFGTGDFTIEFWMYMTNSSSGRFISNRNPTASSTGTWGVVFTPTSLGFEHVVTGATPITGVTSSLLNRWVHVAITRVSGVVYVYENGAQRASSAFAVDLNSAAHPLQIGVEGSSLASFTGNISCLRIVKGTAVYTSNFTPSTTTLTAITNTSLLTCLNNTYKDYSTNNFAVTRYGDLNYSPAHPFISVSNPTLTNDSLAITNNNNYTSWYFDGTGDYVNVNNSISFNFDNQDFTIETWFYSIGNPDGINIFGKRGSTSEYNGITLYFWSDNYPRLVVTTTPGQWALAETSTTPITLGQWVHFALVRKGNRVRLFQNGIPTIDAVLTAPILTNTSLFTIGAGGANGSSGTARPFYISNFKVMKGTAKYDAPDITVPVTPLAVRENTVLLTANSSTLSNQGTYKFTYPMYSYGGNMNVSTFNPFASNNPPTNGYSVYFDGSGDSIKINDDPSTELGNNDFFIEMWILPKIYNSSTASTWLRKSDGTGYAPVLIYQRYTYIYLYMSFSGTTWDFNAESNNYIIGKYRPGEWNHLVISRQGDYIQTFLNGSPNTKLYLPSSQVLWDNTFTWTIGGLTTGADPVNGYFSNFRLVKGSNNVASLVNSLVPMTSYSQSVPTGLLDMSTADFYISAKYPWHEGNNVSTLTVNGQYIKKDLDTPFRIKYPLPTGIGYSCLKQKDSDSMFGIRDMKPGNTSLNFKTNPFTVECWVLMADYQKDIGICGKGTGNVATAGATGWSFVVDSNGYPAWSDGANPLMAATSGPKLQWGAWTHIAAVREGIGTDQFKLYVNGKLSYTGTLSSDYNSADMFQIMTSRNEQYWFKYCRMSSLKVSSVARYNSTFDPTSDTFWQQLSDVDSSTVLLTATMSQGNKVMTSEIGYKNYGYLSNLIPQSRQTTKEFGQSHPSIENGYSIVNMDGNANRTLLAKSLTNYYNFGTTSDFTIEAWIYPTVLPTFSTIVGGPGPTNGDFYFGLKTTNLVFGRTFAASDDLVSAGITLTINTWYHVAACRSNGTLKLFVNGVQYATGANTQNYTITTNLAIGTSQGTSGVYSQGNFFNGNISNLRISKNALYTSNFTPSSVPLVSTTDTLLLTCQSSDLYKDNSSSKFSVMRYGDTKFVTNQTPFVSTGSVLFDGTGDYMYTSTSPSLDLNTDDFTIELWYNEQFGFGDITYNRYLFDSRYYFNDTGIAMRWTKNSGIDVITSGVTVLADNSNDLGNNIWTHLCVQRANNVLALYINGKKKSEMYWDKPITAPQSKMYIGNGSYPNLKYQSPIYGFLSDFRILKGKAFYALNGYNLEGFDPPEEKLEVTTDCILSTASGSTVMDYSTKNFVQIGGRYEANFTTAWDVYVSNRSPYRKKSTTMPDDIYGNTIGSNSYGYYLSHANVNAAGSYTEMSRHNRMTGPWTMEGWFMCGLVNPASPTASTPFSMGATASQNGFDFSYNSNGSAATAYGVAFMHRSEKNGTQIITSPEPTSNLAYHSWNHWAVQYDPNAANKVALFINGKRVAVRAAFTAGDDIYNQSTLYSANSGHADVRISDVARYNNDSETYTMPTKAWTEDSNTEVLIKYQRMFEDSTNQVRYELRGTIPSYQYSKWGKGSLRFGNTRTSMTDLEFYYSGYSWWNTRITDLRYGDFTVECWAAWNNVSTGGITYRQTSPGSCLFHIFNSLWVGIDTLGNWQFIRRSSSTDYDKITSSIKVSDVDSGNFDFIVLQRFKQNYYLYVNGVLVGISNSSNHGTYTTNGPTVNLFDDHNTNEFRIGADYNSSVNNSWCGYVEDFRFTSKARYWTKVINGVSTMCHINSNTPGLPTAPFPRK